MNTTQSEEIKSLWKKDQIVSLITPPDDDLPPGDEGTGGGSGGGSGCQNIYYGVDPLIKTAWGQGFSYNNSTPFLDCETTINGNALTGCAATATAQIMKFQEFPTNYNWSNMPNTIGTIDTSNLMRDIGDAVNMQWGCISSGAYTSDIVFALKNNFGYSRFVTDRTFDKEIVKYQLEHNKPVLLYGYNNNSGHIWVCDGFSRITYCETGAVYLLFHMNWGWNGVYDGWYDYKKWNVNGTNFNSDKGMIYNIIP